MSEPQEVYVLTIEHRHGRDARVFRSYDGALHAAADFAREYWDELGKDDDVPGKPPESDEETVELYFGGNPDEDYVIWPVEVEP